MVLNHINNNFIWADAMKNRTEGEMISARDRALMRIKATGLMGVHEVLDNECSALYKKQITYLGMTYERVPLDNHRHNLAK